MSSVEEVKQIMWLNEESIEYAHMCDVTSISENGVHLESWNEDIPKSDFDQIAELISKDGYDIAGFELMEIPHPKVFCFGNEETRQAFDVVKLWDDKWQISTLAYNEEEGYHNVPADSIKDAISKYVKIE